MTFGERVAQLREMRGWSRAELAERSALQRSYIYLLETGGRKNPTLDVLRRLGRAFGVSLDMLTENVESERHPTGVGIR